MFNKMVFPDGVTFEVLPSKKTKDTFDVEFTETYSNPEHGLIENTVAAMKNTARPGWKVSAKKLRGKGVTIYMHCKQLTRTEVGNMMLGEFFPWSNLGDVTIKTLYERAVNIIAYQAVNNGSVKADPPKKR